MRGNEAPAADDRANRLAGGALRRLTGGEAPLGADVLVASHGEYPAFVALCADPTRRRAMLRPFFEMTVGDAVEHGQVWAVEDGRVGGVAVWMPPGAFPWSARRKVRALPSLARVAVAAPLAFGRFARYGANVERAHPGGDHWYLVAAGVHPEFQRRGIGGRVLSPALCAADQEGFDCYLETSDPANVAYYRRFGFELVAEGLQLVPSGPTHTAMRRPARRSGDHDRDVA